MFRSFGSSGPVRAFCFLLLLTLAFLVSGAAMTVAASGPVRITAAANVTLRSLPSATSPVVAQIPLGTELTDSGLAGLDKTWLRVTLPDGREGWVLSNLTKPLDPQWRWPTFDAIIADRLGRKGDQFPALAELVAFIERVAPEYTDPDGRARIEFARVRALSATAKAIPFRGGKREPYAAWLKGRSADVVYNEPGGQWMVTPRTIWDTHSRIESAQIADQVAWFAVNNGLGGECEGHVPCYLDRRNRLHGEYLRQHPDGQYAAEAVGVLKETADEFGSLPKLGESFKFDRARDCRDLTASVDALTSAVKGTSVGARDAALASLTSVRRICQ